MASESRPPKAINEWRAYVVEHGGLQIDESLAGAIARLDAEPTDAQLIVLFQGHQLIDFDILVDLLPGLRAIWRDGWHASAEESRR